jgi:TonB-linked SusC/RagA family outer membrane protein
MKKFYLHSVFLLMMYSFSGFVLQVIFMQTLLASESGSQGVVSVRDAIIKVNAHDISILDVFSLIESQTEYTFAFDTRDIDHKVRINFKAERESVAHVLTEIAKISDLRFKQVNNNIHVSKANNKRKPAIIIETLQTRTISGRITSAEDNQPLPGVNVIERGTNNGTVSDIDGRYTLNVSEGATLVFSFVGYSRNEVAVGNRSAIDLAMRPDISQLEELVVVGYGTQQKVNLTGAVGVTDGDVLENRPIANVGEGLQGMVPNLNVDIRNGDPAEPIRFNIRGFESINGGQPLVLVDGVPMDMNRLNPNDIKSVTVLKDAAAAAVYGARAAFGVILVETKEGRGDKINITFGSEFAASKPIFLIDPITDPHQFVLARNMATMRTNGTNAFDQDMIDGTKAWSENPTLENTWKVYNGTLRHYGYNGYVDRLITDFAPQQKYDMSISGARDNSSFYVSFGHLSKDGYLKNSEKNEKFKRYNALLKGDFDVTNWLKTDSRILMTVENSDKPHFYNWDVNINTSARVDPLNPIQFPDLPYYLEPGDRDQFKDYIGMYFHSVNFLPYLEQGGRQTWNRNDIVLTQGLNLTPLQGLNIRGEISANFINRDFQDVASKVTVLENMDLAGGLRTGHGFSGNDWINNRTDNDQYYVVNTYADYTLGTSTSHYLKLMAGFNQEWGLFKYIRSQAYGLITPSITDLNATTGNQETYGGKQHTALRGVFYRVNYIFKDRYLIEANGRYDGTSRFPKEDRFGFFPSFSVGWRISNEQFMTGASSWLNELKVRASYGELGNQLLFSGNNPVYYPYIPTMGSNTSSFMMSAGSRIPYVSAAGLVSPTLTWETVATTNFGLDFTLFNNRLDVSFDIYNRDTKDMLMDVTYPAILGTSAPKQNAADLRTRGWELAATWQNRINNDWNYSFTLAFSDNVTEITKYNNPTGRIDDYYVGKRIGERWGFETAGIFQNETEVNNWADQSRLGSNWRPGDIKYADLNNDGVISEGTRTLDDHGDLRIIAYEAPRYNYGLNTNWGWRNFSLNVFFQGLLKYDYWPPNGNWQAFYPFNAGHVEWYYLTDTWSESNPNAYFAAPHISTNTKQNILPQSRYVQNGAYVRLKNLTLSYALPAGVSTRVGLTNAQIYFAGMNMWEATKMRRPLDPEVRPTLTQEYYKQRSYSLGLKIGF